MAEGFALKADVRERTGKGAARALRRDGMIPAVIYGNKEPPLPIAIPRKEVTLILHGGGFKTNIWNIEVGGKTVQALARDYQLEPVKDFLTHVDFLRVSARSRVTIDVPIHVVGDDVSPGIKEGGTLMMAEHTVSVEAPATHLPHAIELDISAAEVGTTFTTDDLKLPGDVSLVAEEGMPVASLAAPTVAQTNDDAESEAGSDGESEGS